MTSGEGGMVSAATDEVERLLRLYRNQGMQRQYENEVVGFNNRMTDIHAAIGRVQLTKVDRWTKQRQENAAFLSANLDGVTPPAVADGAAHVYHQYTIRVAGDRDGLAAALKDEHNIGSGRFYPIPNHRLATFRSPVELRRPSWPPGSASRCQSIRASASPSWNESSPRSTVSRRQVPDGQRTPSRPWRRQADGTQPRPRPERDRGDGPRGIADPAGDKSGIAGSATMVDTV